MVRYVWQAIEFWGKVWFLLLRDRPLLAQYVFLFRTIIQFAQIRLI